MRWPLALGSIALVAACVACVACGGKVLEDSPTATITGENIPPSTQAAGCQGACERFVECKVDYDLTNRDCLDDCSTEFPDPATAKRWGSCVEALSCQLIRDGQYMNYGPLGECATRARTGR